MDKDPNFEMKANLAKQRISRNFVNAEYIITNDSLNKNEDIEDTLNRRKIKNKVRTNLVSRSIDLGRDHDQSMQVTKNAFQSDGISNINGKRRSSIMTKYFLNEYENATKFPPYFNETGPGQYDLTSTIGATSLV